MFMPTPTKIPSSTPIARHRTNVANVGIKSFPRYRMNSFIWLKKMYIGSLHLNKVEHVILFPIHFPTHH